MRRVVRGQRIRGVRDEGFGGLAEFGGGVFWWSTQVQLKRAAVAVSVEG